MGQSALKSFDFEKFCGEVEVLTSPGTTGVFNDEKLHQLGAQYLQDRDKRLRQSADTGTQTQPTANEIGGVALPGVIEAA